MKAVVFERYGSPDVLTVADVETPVPHDHRVLLKVHAGAVNPADYGAMRGSTRLMTGVLKPKLNRLGIDVAGEVRAIGDKVTRFKPGDLVYGGCIRNPWAWSQTSWFSDYGSFAEFALSHEDALDLKPENLSFAEAASVPSVAWTALQGLDKYGGIQPGHKVLINSATGGIGTMAVQIAKALGAAEVTGVCSTKNIDLVKSLGADHVIDYAHEGYLTATPRYDLIFDSVGTDTFRSLRKMLNPGGRVVMVGVRNNKVVTGMFARALVASVLSRTTRDVVVDFSRPTPDDLQTITTLLSTGKLKPVVAREFSGLAQVAEAQRYVIDGHAWGKAVVTI